MTSAPAGRRQRRTGPSGGLGAARTAGVFGLGPFIGAGLALLIAPVIPG